MSGSLEAIRVSDHVYWVGAIDWELRNFHGYLTTRGTTYNAFLLMGESITLVDTVKAPFRQEMLTRIASVVDPARIETIISNHSEMDHSGCLPQIIEQLKPKRVLASQQGAKALEAHFRIGSRIEPVAEGQTVNLGGLDVTFVETRLCHWPDSMFSYLHQDRVLFSQDGFGMHLATSEMFADQVERWLLDHEADKYFANILLPLANFINKTLDKVGKLNLPLDVIAPDHGPIYRRKQDIEHIVGLYARWAAQKRLPKAVIVYDTMWSSTAAMAAAIGDGIKTEGAEVILMPLASCHRSDVATEILEAGALVVGTPTMNGTMFPTLGDVMTYLKGLKPKGMVGATFGSYGWSGEGAKEAATILQQMGVELLAEPLQVQYVPDEAALARCHELGRVIGKKLKTSYTPR
ncbi:MAG: FprA family A-type flavoprotein [Planctomycetaceae bacterium]|nr:FprA family A-type flavoprotein [Planctomycetaceae bacterium]